jgi:hypothetical protein
VKILALLFIATSGCTLFESTPDRTCKVSSDCFQAQGEVCDQDKKVCVAGPDARPIAPASTSSEQDQVSR